QELRLALDEEIGALSETYRGPIVLCYLEGKTYEQAARELGCTRISLARRHARARELLRRRLTKRGITLSLGALTTELTQMGTAAPLPAMLTVKTLKAAALVATGKSVASVFSATAVALAEQAATGMLGLKGKVILILVAFGMAVGSAGWA